MSRLLALACLVLFAVVGVSAADEPAASPSATHPAAASPAPTSTPSPSTPSLIAPLPFDHAQHASTFEDVSLACVDCHPVGLRVNAPEGAAPPDHDLTPPASSCHGCHLGEFPRAPRDATGSCAACHSDMAQLLPTSHGPDWIGAHAQEGRAFRRDCEVCHEAAQCFDCHDDRGPGSRNPHPPAFRAIHGVPAQLDPQSCTSCHTAETCTSCHSSGAGGGWPW